MAIFQSEISEVIKKLANKSFATQEEREEIWDEHHEIFENAVTELEAAWGGPASFGPSLEAAYPWCPLGEEMACWERGEYIVCVFFGQEDAELPIAVDVAVIRRDADWSGHPRGIES